MNDELNFDINPKNIFHIGDNKVSDYDTPNSLGINSYFLANRSDYLDQVYNFENYFKNNILSSSWTKKDNLYWSSLLTFREAVKLKFLSQRV